MNTKQFSTKAMICMALLIASQQAYSLSCMRVDPVNLCKTTDNPVWAKGELRLSKIISQIKKEGSVGAEGPAVADYLFTGTISDKAGKREVKNAKLRVNTSCAGPWCTRLPKDKVNGGFILKADDNSKMSLNLGPCSFQPFTTVTQEQEKAIQACVTPKPAVPMTPPKETKKKGASQIYSQRNHDKKLVE